MATSDGKLLTGYKVVQSARVWQQLAWSALFGSGSQVNVFVAGSISRPSQNPLGEKYSVFSSHSAVCCASVKVPQRFTGLQQVPASRAVEHCLPTHKSVSAAMTLVGTPFTVGEQVMVASPAPHSWGISLHPPAPSVSYWLAASHSQQSPVLHPRVVQEMSAGLAFGTSPTLRAVHASAVKATAVATPPGFAQVSTTQFPVATPWSSCSST
mmetsp:Transcript_17382/g.44127  ORF Transcript_17382/g.44127 Transcript_17382/m.44127 type:complete len:211 (-) Transcript_17382:120-752(-)